jgi:hypothetical protein
MLSRLCPCERRATRNFVGGQRKWPGRLQQTCGMSAGSRNTASQRSLRNQISDLIKAAARAAASFLPAPANQTINYVNRTLILFTSAGKLHREPHCIVRKPRLSRLSDIQECCPDPRRRFGKIAQHLYHTCAQHGAPMRHILRKPEPFGDIRACCLLALARRCTVFVVLCRMLPQLRSWLSLAQHCSERQKLGWQQREATLE